MSKRKAADDSVGASAPKSQKPASVDEAPGNPIRQATLGDGTRVVRMQRRGGKVVQGCDVYVGRECNMGGWRLPRSKWSNPFTIKQYKSAERVVALYEDYVRSKPELMDSLGELRGKTLGCWCAPAPCHGDVLAKLVREKCG